MLLLKIEAKAGSRKLRAIAARPGFQKFAVSRINFPQEIRIFAASTSNAHPKRAKNEN